MVDFETTFYALLLYAGFAMAAVSFAALYFISAPYGRHGRKGWGPSLPPRLGWMVMELPAALGVPLLIFWGTGWQLGPVWIFAVLWEIHYFHRAFVFPFRLKPGASGMPVLVVLPGVVFNCWNAYLNGRYLGLHSADYSWGYLLTPQFLSGAFIFLAGYLINQHADWVLFSLRKSGEKGYKIPHGGMYRWISCPNYFGEILEWAGWAVMVWNPAGFFFLVWTMANLVPRAVSHHQWYGREFPEYPKGRKAVFPFIY